MMKPSASTRGAFLALGSGLTALPAGRAGLPRVLEASEALGGDRAAAAEEKEDEET